jgi:tripartite-type tricarboxylate transporter receptor subunit TctC
MNPSFAGRLCALASLLAASGVAWAQAGISDFPNRHINLVVPYSPGGATDTQSRIVATELSVLLKQPVTVENRPGGSAAVGMAYLARAKPDGYTFAISDVSPLANSPHIQRKLPFDPLKDFDPIILIATTDLVLVVHPSLGISSVKDLIQFLKSKPRSLDFASYGIGSISHLAAELFMSMAKVEMVHVPYSGSTAAFADLIPGRVPIMFSIMPPTVGHIKGGKLQPLGVTGPKRNDAIPDVPPIAEVGVPGYNATSWFVFLLPAGTPKEIVARLNSEINKVLVNPAVRKRFADLGLSIEGGTPDKASAHIRSEFEKWRQVVKDAGIKPED